MTSKEIIKPAYVIGSSLVLALGFVGCGPLKKESAVEAVEQYNQVYRKASPSEKFVLSYGIKNEISNENVISLIGSGCFDGTAYDIDGGQIAVKFSSLFSRARAKGKTPTALATAKIDSVDKNLLVVSAGKSDVADLVFEGLIDLRAPEGTIVDPDNINKSVNFLTAANQATENVLKTYDCDPGYRGTYN